MAQTTHPPATPEPAAQVGPERARHVIGILLGAVVIAFGLAIALGILRTVWDLVGNRHPDPGWGYYPFDDAVSIYLGHLPYQDPDVSYTGLLYPPVFGTIVAGLLHLTFWTGWGVLLSIASGLGLVALVARTAYRPSAAIDIRPVRIAEALAIGLVGWWVVTIIPESGLVDSRPDTLSWAFGLTGLLLLPRALHERRTRRLVGAGALLSLAFWTKQPALAASIAAATFTAIVVLAGVVPWRRGALFLGGLAAVNLAILGVLDLITHGWLSFLVFTLARRQAWNEKDLDRVIFLQTHILWVPAAFAVLSLVTGALALWLRRTGPTPRLRELLHAPEGQRFLVLALFVVIVGAMESYFLRKQGAETEHMIGPAWGLVLLAAVGYRWTGADRRLALVPPAAVAAMAVAAWTAGTREDPTGTGHVPLATDVHVLSEVPAGLVALARTEPIYSSRWSDLSRRDGHITTNYTACDLTAGGVHPGALERTLLDRTYALVGNFPETDAVYCSGNGKWEDNYFWKLNRVIDRGYAPPAGVDPATPGVLFERRPGAVDMDAVRGCFAPFALGGALFRIGHGGGFWCLPSSGAQNITLGASPARFSEIRTDGIVTSISGTLTLTLPKGTGSITISAERSGATAALAQLGPKGAGKAPTLTLSFDGAASSGRVQTIDPAAVRGARLLLAATPGSDATFDLSATRIATRDGTEVGKAADDARAAAAQS